MPITNAVMLNFSSAGEPVLTPAMASAVPVPIFDAAEQAVVPCASSASGSHFFRPLVEDLMCLPMKTLIESAVCELSSLISVRFTLTAFGFFFLPAFFGDRVTSNVAPGVSSGSWALAMDTAAKAVSAASAAIRILRK